MGNSSEAGSEADLYVHPRLGNIRRIQEPNASQYIDYELLIENQKVYDDWLKELRFIRGEEAADEILFLPLQHSFRQTAYCGTGGLASVSLPRPSCATRTTSTRCCRRSPTGGRSSVPSTSRSCSTCSTAW
jgi:hypothetical protein